MQYNIKTQFPSDV